MRLQPTRANSISTQGYKFQRGQWTVAKDADLDWLLCRWVNYVLMEDEFSGPYWVRNIGKKSSFRYFINGTEHRLRIPVGEMVPLERHIAYQLVPLGCVDVPPLSEIASPGDRVLVLRYGGLGDVLMTTPAVAAAAEQLGVVIDYSTSDYLVRLLQHNPSIQNVYGYRGFDPHDYKAVVDLRRLCEAAPDSFEVPRPRIFARAFGVEPTSYRMRYEVTSDEREAINEIGLPESYTVVQASGSIQRRTLPKHRTVELVKRLVEMGSTPVVVDDRVDSTFDVEGALNLTGKLTIPELFAVVERADMTIAGDSGVMHASLAVGTKTLGLFGPVDPELRVAGQENCRTISVNRWRGCSPCNAKQLAACKHSENCLDPVPIDVILEEVAALGDH
jgi:ADP-heptose:LPS heptosyltransferase